MEFIIVSGLSGAGKSKIASFLEDFGFYCVDNMPVELIDKFAALCMAEQGKYAKVALVTDVRGGRSFEGLFKALNALTEMNFPYKILFVEASVPTLINRYKESRHKHPMATEGIPLEETVRNEQAILAPVRARAEYIIDTTALSTAKLRGELLRLFVGEAPEKAMSVNVISFGFKYGVPIESDLVFDVRFLPNPYYMDELREETGLSESVRSFLFGYRQTGEFMRRLTELISFLLPLYVEEGKSALVISIGCTGGRHRSVAITRALAEFIRQKGYDASENHRDMTR
ncbi:MAG: RNase adapter RapZ [Oscillospiraceae bacterium]|nr:RNase adapter RapZ [Oscillospiraceae bacterium]